MKILLITVCFISCAVCAIAQPTILRIDPSNAMGGSASQIFEEINYIPLETTKESLFGKIDQLEVTDKYFVVLDKTNTNSILIFNKKGKFYSKISDKKLSLQEVRFLKDENRLLVYLLNTQAFTPELTIEMSKNPKDAEKYFRKLVSARFYDLEGNQLADPVPEAFISIEGAYSKILYPGTTVSNKYNADKYLPDSTAWQLNIYKNNQLYKSWFPYNTKKDIFRCGVVYGGGIYKSKIDSLLYYTRPFDFTIYKLTADTLLPGWKFIFPMKNTVDESMYNDSTSTNYELKAIIKKNSAWITTLDNIHVFNDLLLFRLVNNETNFDKSNSLIYNLKSGSLISVSKSTPDKKIGYLPFLDDNFYYENFIGRDETYLYSNTSSLKMFRAKEETADKNPVYPPVIKNYFTTESRKSNPVIVQLKPKENL